MLKKCAAYAAIAPGLAARRLSLHKQHTYSAKSQKSAITN